MENLFHDIQHSGTSFDTSEAVRRKTPATGLPPVKSRPLGDSGGLAESFSTTFDSRPSKFKPAKSTNAVTTRIPSYSPPRQTKSKSSQEIDDDNDELDTLSNSGKQGGDEDARPAKKSTKKSSSPSYDRYESRQRAAEQTSSVLKGLKFKKSKPDQAASTSQPSSHSPASSSKSPTLGLEGSRKSRSDMDFSEEGDDEDDELRIGKTPKAPPPSRTRSLAIGHVHSQTSKSMTSVLSDSEATPKPSKPKPRPRPITNQKSATTATTAMKTTSTTKPPSFDPFPLSRPTPSIADSDAESDRAGPSRRRLGKKAAKVISSPEPEKEREREAFPLALPRSPPESLKKKAGKSSWVETDRDEESDSRRGRPAQSSTTSEKRARSVAVNKPKYKEDSSEEEEKGAIQKKSSSKSSKKEGKVKSGQDCLATSTATTSGSAKTKKRKGKKKELEAFPLKARIPCQNSSDISPLSSPLGKRSSSEDISDTDRRKKRRTEAIHSPDSPPETQWDDEGESMLAPIADPSTLCPYCDSPLPSSPSPYLKQLLASLIPRSKRDPRPSNPLGRRALLSVYVSTCQRHRFESQLLPQAEKNGWPKTIAWSKLQGRVEKMEPALKQLIGDLKSEDSKAMKSVFWTEVMAEVREKGSRVVAGVYGQMASFEKSRPGYYGELGSVIIHQSLYIMFPPESIDASLIAPLTINDFFLRVLVPEVAARLIMEDRKLVGSRGMVEAVKILRASSSYGVAMFPEDSGEGEDGGSGRKGKKKDDLGMGVVDAMIMERARRRRKEIEAEEAEEERRIAEQSELERLESEREAEQVAKSKRATRATSQPPPPSSSQRRVPLQSSQTEILDLTSPPPDAIPPPITSRPRPRPITKKSTLLSLNTDSEAEPSTGARKAPPVRGRSPARNSQDSQLSSLNTLRSNPTGPSSRATSRASSRAPSIPPRASRAPSRAPSQVREHAREHYKPSSKTAPLSDVDTNKQGSSKTLRARSTSVARSTQGRARTIELTSTEEEDNDEDDDDESDLDYGKPVTKKPRNPSKSTDRLASTSKVPGKVASSSSSHPDPPKRTRSARSVDQNMAVDSDWGDVEVTDLGQPTPKKSRVHRDPDATPMGKRPVAQFWKPETIKSSPVTPRAPHSKTTRSSKRSPESTFPLLRKPQPARVTVAPEKSSRPKPRPIHSNAAPKADKGSGLSGTEWTNTMRRTPSWDMESDDEPPPSSTKRNDKGTPDGALRGWLLG